MGAVKGLMSDRSRLRSTVEHFFAISNYSPGPTDDVPMTASSKRPLSFTEWGTPGMVL